MEELDENTVLVEFADEQGKTLERVAVPKALLARITPSTPNLLLDVTAVEALPGFVLRLTFENGEVRRFSMARLLAREAPVFTPLRKVTMFRQVFIANGTVCWPGGADIDPELLYEQSVPVGEDSFSEELKAMPNVGGARIFVARESMWARGCSRCPMIVRLVTLWMSPGKTCRKLGWKNGLKAGRETTRNDLTYSGKDKFWLAGHQRRRGQRQDRDGGHQVGLKLMNSMLTPIVAGVL